MPCRANKTAAPETEGKTVRWARLYDLGTTLLSFGQASALRRSIVELARVASGGRVLDVGCGPGRLTILAANITGQAGEACGIDPAPEMVELARRKAARAGVRARFDVGVIEALPYSDNHFDVVLSSLMLHHLPDEVKRRGLAEVRRVLKPVDAFMQQSKAVIAHDADAQLGKIRVPTQITFGRHDMVTSTRFAERMKNGIMQSELVIFETCSHAPIYEQVAEFNQKTLAFLSKH